MKLQIQKVFRRWWDTHPWRIADYRYFVDGVETDMFGRALQVKS